MKSFTSPNIPFPFSPSILSFFVGICAYAPSESRLAYGQLTYDFTGTFSNLSIPTLNIYGLGDQIVNPEHSRMVANSRPTDTRLNRVFEYNDIGHVPSMWENPKRFEKDLKKI